MQRMPISIHALARRATSRRRPERGVVLISIHALARRATVCKCVSFPRLLISIHALARRATALTDNLFLTSVDFNPRSRKESDLKHVLVDATIGRFQSTLSQGERRRVHKDAFQRFIFQSTLSQGERLFKLLLCDTRLIISIHALARRATGHILNQGMRPSNFNPRSRKESDAH